MNRLQLTQRLLQESGLAGSVSGTTGQTGEAKQLVDWIDSAYMDILTSSRFWLFMRSDFTMPLSNGVSSYAASVAGVTDLSQWRTDDWRCYLTTTADEQWIEYVPYSEFRLVWLMGPSRTQAGRPQYFTVKPNKELLFHPVPNDAFFVVGEYQKAPTAMATDTATPVFGEDYHMAIVWRALMFFAGFHSEPDKFALGQNEFRRVMQAMKAQEIEQIAWGQPLA
jgi:hypothetical protein